MSEHRQQYVVGVMLTPRTVLLVHKNRPAFQAGKWNGIGGKVEPGEHQDDAMVREFYEECGVQTKKEDWQHTVWFEGDDFDIFWYRSFVNTMPAYRTMTDEEIAEIDLSAIYLTWAGMRRYSGPLQPYQTLDNMKWLLPININKHIGFPMHVRYMHSDEARAKELANASL